MRRCNRLRGTALFLGVGLGASLIPVSTGWAIPPGWKGDDGSLETDGPGRVEALPEVTAWDRSRVESTALVAGGDQCSDATPVAVAAGPPGSPNTVTINGDSSGATGPECFGSLILWWEAFTLDKCADVIIDFCTTSPTLSPSYIHVHTECSADGSTCDGFLGSDPGDGNRRDECPGEGTNGNITMRFSELAPGTYYYPIIADPGTSVTPGPYVMHVTAEECSGACSGCLGACCNTDTESCVNDVASENCAAGNEIWTPRARCCEVECRDPAGGEFGALDVELLSRVSIEDLATFNGTPGDPHTGNEMWGYTSPRGREYAIIGMTSGTGFIEITDPRNPMIVDFISSAVDITWRDMDTYKEYAYVVTDVEGVGLETFDLTDIDNGAITALGIAPGGMTKAHNVYVNKASGRAYACGAAPFGTGFVVYTLADPAAPVPVGVWEGFYVHDLHVVSYAACPSDISHVRSGLPCEIAFCFAGGSGMKILDVTDPTSMLLLSTLTYPTIEYCHQGWLSDDRNYVFFDDELDENNGDVTNTRTYVADVQDLVFPSLVEEFDHAGCWIDHNLIARGDRVYQAHYAAGMRVLDASNPLALAEVAYFDTRPEDNQTGFPGAWGVYPFSSSRVVTVSDRQRGLFVLCDQTDKPIAGFVVAENPGAVDAMNSFTATGSTVCDPARSLTQYEWDFDYDGATFTSDLTGASVQHAYDAEGTYTIALRVTDDQGGEDVATFSIEVGPAIPAVSSWGLVAFALLLFASGTLAIRRRGGVSAGR